MPTRLALRLVPRDAAIALLVLAACCGRARASDPTDDGSARLARIRESAALASSRAEVDALARDADGFSSDTARIDARLLAAQAYLGRFGVPPLGRALLRRVASDPAADALTAAQATNLLVRSDLDDGLVDDARVDVAAHAFGVRRELLMLVEARVRRRALHRACLLLVGAVAVAVASSVARGVVRSRGRVTAVAVGDLAGVALAFGVSVAVGGGGLASLFTGSAALPFVGLGAALVPVVLAARAWSASASPLGGSSRASRACRAIACAGAALASAFLVLEGIDASYLASFGL